METKEYPSCPTCREGIGEMHKIQQAEVEKGNWRKELIPAAEIGIHVTYDPTKLPLVGGRVPALRSYKDICEICGSVWAFRVDVGHVTYTGDTRQPFKDFK
jgi:hypothetical protein